MKQYDKEIGCVYPSLIAILVALLCAIIVADFSINDNKLFCPERASNFGDFFGGFLGTIFSGISLLFLAYTYKTSQEEKRKERIRENFFRLVDAHTARVNRIKVKVRKTRRSKFPQYEDGEYAFVQIKLSIHSIYGELSKKQYNKYFSSTIPKPVAIYGTAYTLVFFGIDKRWKKELEKELIYIKETERSDFIDILSSRLKPSVILTMQTALSSYYRNMYRAIKLVDDCNNFTDQEKYDLISIYRAQLSNPELYILACSLMSRFGKKWIEEDYICKYRLLNGLPKWQLEGVEGVEDISTLLSIMIRNAYSYLSKNNVGLISPTYCNQ